MTVKGMLDRKLMWMVLEAVMRRAGTALAAYLVAKGFPSDQIDQLLTALAAVLGIVFDLSYDALHRRVMVSRVTDLMGEVVANTRADTINEIVFKGDPNVG